MPTYLSGNASLDSTQNLKYDEPTFIPDTTVATQYDPAKN